MLPNRREGSNGTQPVGTLSTCPGPAAPGAAHIRTALCGLLVPGTDGSVPGRRVLVLVSHVCPARLPAHAASGGATMMRQRRRMLSAQLGATLHDMQGTREVALGVALPNVPHSPRLHTHQQTHRPALPCLVARSPSAPSAPARHLEPVPGVALSLSLVSWAPGLPAEISGSRRLFRTAQASSALEQGGPFL
jgi:hypothetical protein